MENLWIDLAKYDIRALLHDLIEASDDSDRKYPNVLSEAERISLICHMFPIIPATSVQLGSPLPASLVDSLTAQRGDVHLVIPSNVAAVLLRYHV